MFSWKRPSYLGVKDGRLAPPKRTPNCVSSQADPGDALHYVEPIAFKGSQSDLRRVVEVMRGATVIEELPGYLYAEYRSPLMGFVDDVEFLFADGVLHVRSASRLGRRDFGVNRNRVEKLRRRLTRAPR